MIEITPRKMTIALSLHFYFLLAIMTGNASIGQRIVTIQLDGTQYYVSKMNPYSSELNYFLAYQYCRSIGLQLVSFETQEKADAITEYLKNAGYSQHDFWTSGNHLGSNMLLWMSTGLPFNATFNYMRKQEGDDPIVPSGPLPMGRKKRGGMANTGCIALKANSLDWDTEDCSKLKEFICEQTRCYFYNYGSIPVSPAQGHNHRHKEQSTTTSTTYSTIINQSYASSLPTSYSTTSSPAASTSTATITTTSLPPSSTTYQQQYVSKLSTYYLSPITNSPASPAVTTVESRSETEQPSNNNTEEDNNEIDLTTTEIPTTVDYTSLYGSEEANKQEQQQYKETVPDEPPTAVNRTRTTRILETESNSARNMPDAHPEAFPWAWAKNILLEKPVMKKTAQE